VVGRAISADNISEGYVSEVFGVARLKEQAGDFILDPWFLNGGVDTISGSSGFRCGAEIVKAQSDGRLIIAGFSINDDSVNTQNTVLIRLDGSIADAIDEQSDSEILFNVWPNPSNALLRFDSPFGNDATTCTVFDATGRLVLEELNEQESLNISNLAAGVYTLRLTSKSRHATARFVKE
jgi:hypothetical protein